MSEPANVEPEAVEIDRLNPDAAFGALMEALVPDSEESKAAETARLASGGAPAGAAGDAAAAAAGGAAAPAGDETATDTRAGQPGAGGAADAGTGGTDTGKPDGGAAAAGAGGDGAGADGERPATWTRPVAELTPKFGDLSNAFEENVAKGYHEEALAEIRTEYPKYFEQLEKHPARLVGQEVPRIDGVDGMQKLSSTQDARDWQDGVKSILADDLKGRVTKQLDDSTDFLSTVHQSIELFQNNADMVPGTVEFDVELANRFAAFSKPYEMRTEENKLHGFSIPVQPIIDNLRAALVKEREAKGSAPAATGTVTAAGAGSTSAAAAAETSTPPAAAAAPPQAGLTSKAGESDKGEDMSTLWGTLGLPHIPL